MSVRLTLLASAVAILAVQPASAQQADTSCEPRDLAALSDWNKIWAAEGMEAGISGREGSPTYQLVGLDAPWTDEGWKRMRAVLALSASPTFKNSGWGFPMMMHSFSELKFVIAPAETAIIGQYRDIRYVYTDGRGHPPDDELWPTAWGDSTGCWEGDTLVIDTVGVEYDASFNSFSPPVGEHARFVERLKLVSPDRIEAEVTVTDPDYLKEPWRTQYVLIPAGIERLVHDAFEDRAELAGDALTIAPQGADLLTSVPVPDEVKLSPEQLDAVAGNYAVDGAPLVLTVERRGDRLFFTLPPALRFFLPMFATGPLTFDDPGGGTFEFTTDAGGKVTGVDAVNPEGIPLKGIRAP